MSSSTEKIDLIKPLESEPYDIKVFNGNSDKIDKALSDIDTALSEIGQRKQISIGTKVLQNGEEYVIPGTGYKMKATIRPQDFPPPFSNMVSLELFRLEGIMSGFEFGGSNQYSSFDDVSSNIIGLNSTELYEIMNAFIFAVSGEHGIRLDITHKNYESPNDKIIVGWVAELISSGYEQPERRNPYARNEAKDFVEKHGGLNILNNLVENTSQGDWLLYKDMDFKHGAASFVISLSSYHSSRPPGGALELRLDHPNGSVVGTVQYTSTDAWNNFKQFTCAIKGVVGIHHLYLVFTDNGNANLDWFQFTPI